MAALDLPPPQDRPGSPAGNDDPSPARIEVDLPLFQTLINQTNDAILIVDPGTGRILYVNDKTCAVLGYARSELLARRITDVALNVRDESSWRRLVRRVRGQRAALFEAEQRRKDGTRVPVEVNVRYISHAGGEFLVSVARDISDRRRAEVALVEEKNKLEAVLAAIGDGITVQDRQFRILYQNSAHREVYGDHLGARCYEAYHRRSSVCDGCLLDQSFRDGGVRRRETPAITSGGTRHREITTSPVRDARGNIIAGIEVVRDITERKHLENQLNHAQRLESVGRLAGGVAHDFNNSLTAILGYGDMLQAKLDPRDPLQNDVQRIVASAERAAHLTRSLLAFSRKQVIRIKPVDLNDIVRRMEDLLRKLAGDAVEVTADLAPHALVVMADTGQLEQVLLNLVSNARDAMPQGGRLRVRTEQVELADDFQRAHGYGTRGIFAVLQMTDSGTGMDDRTRASMFEPFFTTKEVGQGTGLGLSIVYGVVKQHNGYITVRSREGEGTDLAIYLPVTGAAPGGEEAVLCDGVAHRGSAIVLLAEDDPDVRHLARSALERSGYTVIEAADGDEALARFLEHGDRIDLLVFDVMMPRKNGRDVYEEIRRIRPQVKVLFMSGYTADIIRHPDPSGSGVHFLPKPFTAGRFLGMVREALGTPRGMRGGEWPEGPSRAGHS